MSKRVELVAPFTIPALCCVCMQPSTTSIEARHSQFIPLGPAVHVTSSEVPIPFCALHSKQTRFKMKLCNYAMISCYLMIAVGYGIADMYVSQMYGYRLLDRPIHLLWFFSIAALAIFFGFYERAQMPVRLNAAKTEKMRFSGSSPLAKVILDCDNETFAQAVLHANKETPPPSRPNGTASQHLSIGA